MAVLEDIEKIYSIQAESILILKEVMEHKQSRFTDITKI